MKKNLLIIIFIFAMKFSDAQNCTVDITKTTPGFYPDSATGLPDATVGVLYDTTITVFAAAQDSNYTPFGWSFFAIDHIKIDSNSTNWNLPPNYSVSCEPPNCEIPGGTAGCIRVTGTSVAADTANSPYNLTIRVSKYTSPTTFYKDYYVNYYSIVVNSPVIPTSFSELDKGNSIFVSQNVPNPFSKTTNIIFENNKREEVTLIVYNVLGEVVYCKNISVNDGINNILFYADKLPTGIYSYLFINPESRILGKKRMVLISEKN